MARAGHGSRPDRDAEQASQLITRAMKPRPRGACSQAEHLARLRRFQAIPRHQEDQLSIDLLQCRQCPEQLLAAGHAVLESSSQARNICGVGRRLDEHPLPARSSTGVARQIARDHQQPGRRMLTVGHVIQPPPRDLKRRRDKILSVRTTMSPVIDVAHHRRIGPIKQRAKPDLIAHHNVYVRQDRNVSNSSQSHMPTSTEWLKTRLRYVLIAENPNPAGSLHQSGSDVRPEVSPAVPSTR
jgi:hypothetical protein